MDMTKEMPYVAVNTLLVRIHQANRFLLMSCPCPQDEQNPIGGNYYLKSVNQPRIDLDIARRVRDTVYGLSDKNPGFNITYIFEFWNTSKLARVPADATAFQRSERLSSLANIKYPENTPEQLDTARSIAQQLTGIVVSMEEGSYNTGYANYSK